MAKIEINGVCKFFNQGKGECLILNDAKRRSRERPGDWWIIESVRASHAELPKGVGFAASNNERMCGARTDGGRISEALVEAQRACSGYENGGARKMRVRTHQG